MAKRLKTEQCDNHELSVEGLVSDGPCRASMHGRLAHVARLLARRQQAALAEHSLDLRSYATLARLEHAPCATQLDLAKQSRIDKSSLVAVLDHLEKEGWVERIPDARDRRARIVRATPSGKTRLIAAHQCVRAVEERLLSGLDAATREVFLSALAALAAAE